MANTGTGLQDSNGLDEVGGENELALPVDAQTVGRELLAEDVESALYIFGPLVDNVVVGVSLHETARAGANGGTHVGDEETTLGLCANFIGNGTQDGTVTLLELGTVRVGGIKVVTSVLQHMVSDGEMVELMINSYLSLEERQQTTTPDGLSIKRYTQMVGVVATAGNIGHPQQGAKGVLDTLEVICVIEGEYTYIIQTVSSQEIFCNLVSGIQTKGVKYTYPCGTCLPSQSRSNRSSWA